MKHAGTDGSRVIGNTSEDRRHEIEDEVYGVVIIPPRKLDRKRVQCTDG